jgi:hypothetical protein
VEATSKIPFPEHSSDGMHFVEAEPNAEYYIQLKRIPFGSSSPYLLTSVKVNNHDISDDFLWKKRDAESNFNCCGLISYSNGIETLQSLRFSLPDRFRQGNQSFSPESYLEKMGRVEVFVYEGIKGSNCTHNSQKTKSSFQQFHEENSLVVPVSQNAVGEEKKFVLSKPG